MGGLFVLILTLAVVWMIVPWSAPKDAAAPPADEADPGWFRENPPARGRYTSRPIGSPHIVSFNTYWNGERWIYIGGYDCTIQRREWQPLPEGMAS